MTDHGSTILLPKLIEELRKKAPHSELVLSAVGPQTFDDVAAGRIDLPLRRRGASRFGKRSNFQFGFCLSCWLSPTSEDSSIYTETISAATARHDSDRGWSSSDGGPPAGTARRQTARCIKDSILHTGGLCDCADRSSSHGASHLGQDYRANGRFTGDEFKPFPYFMSWHPRLTNEAAHVWLREQVRARCAKHW